ncbi:MAG: GyrI-like domain-containing protein [Tenericutes bacterium]|nr:GyrI-like domain-containing protein [Mycoplasmatota bacterium]
MKYFVKEYETRYFAGIEYPNGIRPKTNDIKKIPELWEKFFKEYASSIEKQVEPNHLIGLEIYPFYFAKEGVFDYCVLAETKELIESSDEIVTKKLKAAKYICFPINYDNIASQIQKVYKYIKEKEIHVHMGFDYEDYLVGENYGEPGAVLNFCLALEEDA